MMPLSEFLSTALEPVSGLRSGQRFMNALYEHRLELFDFLVYRELDAFYDDDKLRAAIDIVTERWNDPTTSTDRLY